MMFLDSWIWLELYSQSKKWEKCKELILSKEKKYISTMVLMEIRYRGTKKFGFEKTDRILNYIEEDKNVRIIPLTKQIAKQAANLRLKYYKKQIREISYADTVHLATAIMTNCKILYSGDPDFKNIEEIKTQIV